MYFIILSKDNTRGFENQKFCDGLNVFDGDFNDNIIDTIFINQLRNGFHFYDENYILKNLGLYSYYLVDVILPESDINFRMTKHKNFYRSNMIILGQKRMLSDVSTFEYLRNLGSDINGSINEILDWVAYEREHIDIFMYILGHGVDISKKYHSMLSSACRRGNIEIVKYLLEHKPRGKKLDKDNCIIKDTLQSAIVKTHSYIDKKKNINEILCIKNNYIKILELLIDHGASVNDVYSDVDIIYLNEYDTTLLEIACENDQFEIASLLLENGANVNANNGSALYQSCFHASVDMVKWLLDHGADVNDCLALDRACMNGDSEMVELLLEHGADVNAHDNVALQSACYFGNMKIVNLLLEKNANIHRNNDEIMRTRCDCGHIDFIKSHLGLVEKNNIIDSDKYENVQFKDICVGVYIKPI